MHKLMAVGILIAAVGSANAAPGMTGRLTIGTPTAAGATFDAKVVTFAVKRNNDALVACYTKALAKAPELKGTATVTFTIDATGALVATNAKGLNQEAESCIAATVAKMKLEKPKDGKPVDVTLPLTFEQVPAADDDIYGGLLGTEAGETQGGWGFSGTGSGAGCGSTGWGTIGTGRYGKIGHGSGYGTSYGGCGGGRGVRRNSPVPSTAIGQPTVNGQLDKAIIRRYIKRNLQKIAYCYEKQLLAKPGLKGTIKVEFTIAADGKVSASKAAGMKDTDVESCVAGVVRAIEFPKPRNGNNITVVYPLTFKPSGG